LCLYGKGFGREREDGFV